MKYKLEAFNFYKPDRVYKEQVSGRKEDRKELNKALKSLEEGDTFVIYRIDRLSRSVRQLINLEADLREKNIHLKIIHENIDTSTAMGRLVFNILATFAEIESENISMRTKSALEQARKRGVKLGKQIIDIETEMMILDMYESKEYTLEEISRHCNVCLKTVYNMRKRKQNVKLNEIDTFKMMMNMVK